MSIKDTNKTSDWLNAEFAKDFKGTYDMKFPQLFNQPVSSNNNLKLTDIISCEYCHGVGRTTKYEKDPELVYKHPIQCPHCSGRGIPPIPIEELKEL